MTAIAIMDAEHTIQQIESKAVAVALAIRAEAATRLERDDFLEALVNSLLGQPNALTEKPHSATSAEKAAKTTDEYRARDKAVLDAECTRVLAWSDYERAKLTAKLAVVAAGAE